MKKLLAMAVLAIFAMPHAQARGFETQKVSVVQLRQMLAALHGKSDTKVAKQIAELELTERLSRAEFGQISETLPGQQSRNALLAVEDASMFLDPPASELLSEPSPNPEAQKQMLIQAAKLAKDQTERIPDFLVVRDTEHFQDVEVYPYSNKIEYYTPGSFRLLERQIDDISCSSGGDEVLDQPDKDLDGRMARRPQPLMYMDAGGYHTIWGDIAFYLPNATPEGIKPTGAFGPWVKAITGDMPDAKTEWVHWERSASGRLAVFSFRISREQSHYTIEYDPAADSQNPLSFLMGNQFIDTPGYHGEIAIDPNTGRVVRILVIFDLAPDEPISRANIELEYGSVKLGEREYVLPLRGVTITSLSLAAKHHDFDNWSMDPQVQTDHFTVTSVDDLNFSNYRIGRPRQRIVPQLKIAPLKSLDHPQSD